MKQLNDKQIAIIDNGINGRIVGTDKVQSKIFIDDYNNCKEDYIEIPITEFQHGTLCALIVIKYNPHCMLNSLRILDKDGNGRIEKIEPAF